ncbi:MULTISPECIES: cystathionine gamma-synthase [unclassified Pseudoalteromonas]|mgnify:FL=1|uniref:cystathionine gamma-synthase n=1 Tax=unclassified Pseudoalteromonas TaxID=194690 RepID=UPI0007319663|nr:MULTISPECIES: cystathionine gamma-synthase [unclassified Pseudoalteromonas]KTD98322.1 O-succinylhomoserine (thiol)-lyase [Pseudoalteromonas sp. H71]MBW4967055.1 cystathionine gamma-synthase [Pseudoalteromonas sp. CR1]TMN78054.1 O-succinylhomoserine (thiol)-lyase [Pseudoalteromonas sp. S410]TMN90516.1 O-succinylhomoserine (thiol)-lyase [Pseudoalteromonas sp. S408]TMN96405.1 O-succinylhomoserine (thiol)-lyase [Pseudoalteromonas sp. S407]|tara:strand:+ start:143 stop:1390 length:1248 start_codon:yes stop_codon:yes gene_type:complete
MSEKNKATIAVRSGVEADKHHGAVVAPIYLSTTYSFADFDTKRQYDYGRSGNPNRDILAETLAELEGGARGIITATGMSAVHLATQILNHDDTLVIPHDCYGGSYRLFTSLQKRGLLKLEVLDLTQAQSLDKILAIKPKLIWIETPSNPLLRLTDIKAITDIAKQCGALVAADNTFLSPALQNPIKFGVDIVVHSTTKYINGHSDVVGGAVIAASQALGDELAWWANNIGITGAPFDSYLTLRGLRTLNVRLKQHQENALSIAKYLDESEFVRQVYYPGLESHPQHELAKAQQLGFGGMVSFDIKGDINDAAAFLTSLRDFSLAESLGGVESLICHPATMTHAGMEPKARLEAGVGDTLIRVSVGIEDINDLLADLERVFQLVKPGQNKNIGRVGKGAGSPEGNVKLSAARPALW